VVRSRLGANRVGRATAFLSIIWSIFFTGWVIYWIVQLRNWTTRAEIIAFFAGSGGMVLMFHRWRRHGDRLAKALCLASFGTWGLAVITWGVGGANAGKPWSLGFDVAAAALLIGFVGGISVLIRLYAHEDRDSNAPLQ
jgi:hypothetical protein